MGLRGFPIFWLLSKLSIDLQNTIICDKLVFRKEIIIIDSSMEYSRNISNNIRGETTLNNSGQFLSLSDCVTRRVAKTYDNFHTRWKSSPIIVSYLQTLVSIRWGRNRSISLRLLRFLVSERVELHGSASCFRIVFQGRRFAGNCLAIEICRLKLSRNASHRHVHTQYTQ